MYKVFFNDREIVISQKAEIILNKSRISDVNFYTIEDVRNWFLQFAESNERTVVLLHESPLIFFKNVFVPAFLFIAAAGGVVIRDEKILVIFKNNKWDLPKGKIDKDESKETAAIREVEEECSISGHTIIKPLPSTYHIYRSTYKKSKGKWILKKTYWFEMDYKGSKNGKPQTEEGITEIKWLSEKEIDKVLSNTYENLKQILRLYCD